MEIAAYIGKGAKFDEAIGAFARRYADQNERDHAQLVDAITAGSRRRGSRVSDAPVRARTGPTRDLSEEATSGATRRRTPSSESTEVPMGPYAVRAARARTKTLATRVQCCPDRGPVAAGDDSRRRQHPRVPGRSRAVSSTPTAVRCRGSASTVDNGPGTQSDVAGHVRDHRTRHRVRTRFGSATAAQRHTSWSSGTSIVATSGSADPISVTDGVDTPLSDVTLAPGVSVSGTVTDTNGAPLAGISVNVNPTSSGPGSAGTHDRRRRELHHAHRSRPVTTRSSSPISTPTPCGRRSTGTGKPSWNTADTLDAQPRRRADARRGRRAPRGAERRSKGPSAARTVDPARGHLRRRQRGEQRRLGLDRGLR